MAASIQSRYPASNGDTGAYAITLASLADDYASMLTGRASTAIDNRTNLDLDYLVGGFIKLGSSPTAGRIIEVWAYKAVSIASGAPTYQNGITGTDASKTITSANVKYTLKLGASMQTDATTGLVLPIPVFSIASLFGAMPAFHGIFIVHGSGAALDSTGGNHAVTFERIQAQTV